MAAPPSDPGTMTPQSKAALGASLGLDTPPSVLEGSGTTMAASSADTGEMSGEMGDAHAEAQAVQAETRDVLLESPAGSTATQGYHLGQQSEALREVESPLPVGDVNVPRPQEQRA